MFAAKCLEVDLDAMYLLSPAQFPKLEEIFVTVWDLPSDPSLSEWYEPGLLDKVRKIRYEYDVPETPLLWVMEEGGSNWRCPLGNVRRV